MRCGSQAPITPALPSIGWLSANCTKRAPTAQHLAVRLFLKRAQAFKDAAQKTITGQQRKLGISCDWQRQRFTLDEGLSQAVRAAFVQLYNDGLIYRAERLVNWDPVAQTTLSDLEVQYDEAVKGELYHFAYPWANGQGELVVATTRPETLLGDTAVAVHPSDPRYRHLIGQQLKHPLLAKTIPIIGDAILVDPAFGTGAVKVTPAHDHNDFEVGLRHNLERINVLEPDGRMNQAAGAFAGLTVPEARAAVMAKLQELGLERDRVPHLLRQGRSERSGALVEPMLSTQWYVRARPLAAPALAAVERGFTAFVPKTWENTYFSWLRDIKDWCISRQLWWGHRIPAWYCQACEALHVDMVAPKVCAKCGHTSLRQDDDILDTWFSSALWPFSTLGWPEATAELQRWYPTAVLMTGFDIIFFWVARMMMLGQYLMGQIPFKDIYIHGLIRDAQGDKMSKSKGNVIDPLKAIEEYGCDAFRFTLIASAGQGRDVRWDPSRALGYHKFVNKIWQAFRFSLGHINQASGQKASPPRLYERWLMARLRATTAEVRAALATYRFAEGASSLYHFIWNELCDWYIEISKSTLHHGSDEGAKQCVRQTLEQTLTALTKLLQPMMPYLSETLYEALPKTAGSVMQEAYPAEADFPADSAALAEFGVISSVVVSLRRIRAEFGIKPKTTVKAYIKAPKAEGALLLAHAPVVELLAQAHVILSDDEYQEVAFEAAGAVTLQVPLVGLVDVAAERLRLERERAKVTADEARIAKSLSNQAFVAKAPPEVVADKEAQMAAAKARGAHLEAALKRL